jgi:hypothetical protein
MIVSIRDTMQSKGTLFRSSRLEKSFSHGLELKVISHKVKETVF